MDETGSILKSPEGGMDKAIIAVEVMVVRSSEPIFHPAPMRARDELDRHGGAGSRRSRANGRKDFLH
eukprot:scaffold96698_cov31-Tisochrysis_lutea.AAC.1